MAFFTRGVLGVLLFAVGGAQAEAMLTDYTCFHAVHGIAVCLEGFPLDAEGYCLQPPPEVVEHYFADMPAHLLGCSYAQLLDGADATLEQVAAHMLEAVLPPDVSDVYVLEADYSMFHTDPAECTARDTYDSYQDEADFEAKDVFGPEEVYAKTELMLLLKNTGEGIEEAMFLQMANVASHNAKPYR